MPLLKDGIESKKFDTRMSERNVRKGVITQEELKKSLAALPDDSDNAEWISVESLVKAEDRDRR